MSRILPREVLIVAIARLLDGVRHVAVGASSPIPAAGAMLLRAIKARAGAAEPRISILGSVEHNFFTHGSAELFDCAGQGRIDAFVLSGGQIDGQANINLTGIGHYPEQDVRWSGAFGSAYLYFLVPRVILFREEHSRRVFVPKVDFISAPGISPTNVDRPGGAYALVTGLCVFLFQRELGRFRLASVHPGHTVEEVRDETGFEFDCPDVVPETAAPGAETLAMIRETVAPAIAGPYPAFARKVWAREAA